MTAAERGRGAHRHRLAAAQHAMQFGFRLLDKATLDAAIADVERAGGQLIERGERAPGDPFAYIADPDGYRIEL